MAGLPSSLPPIEGATHEVQQLTREASIPEGDEGGEKGDTAAGGLSPVADLSTRELMNSPSEGGRTMWKEPDEVVVDPHAHQFIDPKALAFGAVEDIEEGGV